MINLVILADEIGHKATDLGDRALNSKWTPIVLAVLIAFCAGLLAGIEIIRSTVS